MSNRSSTIARLVEQTLATPIGRFDTAARRRKILCAALDTVVSDPSLNLSMGAVARRAGVSTATLYRDFADRDTLIDAVLDWVVPLLAQTMTEASQEADPRLRLVAMLRAHADAFNDPFLERVLRQHVLGLNELRPGGLDRARAGRDLVESFWREQLGRLEAAGLIRRVELKEAINLLLGPMERRSVMARLLFGDDPQARPTLDVAARVTADAFLLWAAPGPAPPSRPAPDG